MNRIILGLWLLINILYANMTVKRYYIKDNIGSIRSIINENGEVLRNESYYPFGKKMPEKGGSSLDNDIKEKFIGKELDIKTDLINLNARLYDCENGRSYSRDPLADKALGWTPYRYAFNNPVYFVDPSGLWEINLINDGDQLRAILVWQEGDNLKTLMEQTGLSNEIIESYLGEATLNALKEGREITIIQFGGYLNGISDAANIDNTYECNCWGSALVFGERRFVDMYGGITTPMKADQQLNEKFETSNNPSMGDIIRYAEREGYSKYIVAGKLAKEDAADKGDKLGGTSHFANFLLRNNTGVQVFTKNGWFDGWKVMYEKELPSIYGEKIGINGEPAYYKLKP